MTYSFPLYLPASIAAVAIALIVLGVHLKRRNERLRKFSSLSHFACFGLAALGLLFTTGIATDRVVLSEQKLEQNGWFGLAGKGFALASVTSVSISNAEQIGRRGRVEVHEMWTASFSDGPPERVDVGDLWEANGADIVERLRARGIAVNDYR